MAGLFLLCALAPSVALALADGTRSAHCLLETTPAHVHHGDEGSAPHTHDEAPASTSNDEDTGLAADTQCCGLFCISWLASEPADLLDPTHPLIRVVLLDDGGMSGKRIDGLYRPPISLLSV
jgi:hypothetical protein